MTIGHFDFYVVRVTSPPVLTVLGDPGLLPPAGLERLTGRMQLRRVDAAGLAAALPGTEVLLVWDFFSRALREAWPRRDVLAWIHVAATGVDTLLFDELVDSDVLVTNARGVFDRPIAEYVLGALLADVKLLHESHDLQRDRRWQHRETRTLQGARCLVIGAGGIGRQIARLLTGLGVHVIGAARTARDGDDDFAAIVPSGRLVEHVADVDYLVNAAPLTPQTTGLVDRAVLQAMPDHAYLVNVGRGPTVRTGDLVDALRAGRLRGACLDVFDTEPLPPSSPLWTIPGVTVTAHMSGDVVGWRDRLARQFLDLAETYLSGGTLPNLVDKRLGFPAAGA